MSAEKKSRYQLIVDDLMVKITSYHFKPGEQLPGQKELRDHYGVSYGTLHIALAILRDRGVIYGQQGVGIYVREQEDHR